MTSPHYRYPTVRGWVVAEALLRATLDGLRKAGAFRRESGAFWLGSREAEARVSAVVFPRGPGVKEAPGLWRVSPEVFGAITRWAVPLRLCLLAVVHTHIGGGDPFLSWTDRTFGVRVPGVLAVVIPRGGKDPEYLHWGWYVFDKDDYRQLSNSEITERVRIDSRNHFEACFADEVNVRPLRVE